MHIPSFLLILLLLTSTALTAEETKDNASDPTQKCMEASMPRADESMTIKALKDACLLLVRQGERSTNDANNLELEQDLNKPIKMTNAQATANNEDENKEIISENIPQIVNTTIPNSKNNQQSPPLQLLKDRLTIEALNRSNRFILTPNKRNYLLPISYSHEPNREPYRGTDATFANLNHTEAELQLSVKILIRENIFDDNGHLYLGYTNHALWQVYNRRLSAPFRETDHQPELILSFTNDWEILGFRNAVNEAIINHQSNGQTGLLSRSWNRIMFTSLFERGNFALSFNPWYRLPEREQEYPGDPRGDDNPDITTYMGHFELAGAYKHNSNIFSLQLRNNLKNKNYGAVELGWTFPVTKTVRGFMSYFDGYGHSLIDYNSHQRTLGLGVIFTDLF